MPATRLCVLRQAQDEEMEDCINADGAKELLMQIPDNANSLKQGISEGIFSFFSFRHRAHPCAPLLPTQRRSVCAARCAVNSPCTDFLAKACT